MKDKSKVLRIIVYIIYFLLGISGLVDLYITGGKFFRYVIITAVIFEPINAYVNVFLARNKKTKEKYIKRYTGKHATILLVVLTATIITSADVIYDNWFSSEFRISSQLLEDTKSALLNDSSVELVNKVDTQILGTYGSYAATSGLLLYNFALDVGDTIEELKNDSLNSKANDSKLNYIENYSAYNTVGVNYVTSLYNFEKDVNEIISTLAECEKNRNEDLKNSLSMSLDYASKYIMKESKDIIDYLKVQIIIYMINVFLFRYFVKWICMIIMCKVYKMRQDKIVEV